MAYRENIYNQAREQYRVDNRVERIRQYVSDNLSADLGLAAVAEKFGFSVSGLRHLFKKYTGDSYHHFVKEMRMKEAFDLITKEGQRIQQTMYATGYKYRSSFNKAFKKRFKHPPTYFQK